MNLYLRSSKWDDVVNDSAAIKFHALQYLMGNKYATSTAAFQFVKHLEHTKGVVVNLWSQNADDIKP
jgi:hypothetical protein